MHGDLPGGLLSDEELQQHSGHGLHAVHDLRCRQLRHQELLDAAGQQGVPCVPRRERLSVTQLAFVHAVSSWQIFLGIQDCVRGLCKGLQPIPGRKDVLLAVSKGDLRWHDRHAAVHLLHAWNLCIQPGVNILRVLPERELRVHGWGDCLHCMRRGFLLRGLRRFVVQDVPSGNLPVVCRWGILYVYVFIFCFCASIFAQMCLNMQEGTSRSTFAAHLVVLAHLHFFREKCSRRSFRA